MSCIDLRDKNKKLSMVPQLLVVSNRSGAEDAADEIFVLAKLFQGSGS